MNEATGIALNGVLFKAAASFQEYDKIMPRDVVGGRGYFRKSLDQCLGSTDSLDDTNEVSDGYD